MNRVQKFFGGGPRSKRGFTLLETLVALFLISLLLTGASSLVVQSIQFSSLYRDDLTGALLAQEGVELVRYQRDSNRLQGRFWLQGLTRGSPPPCRPQVCIADLSPTDGSLVFARCVGAGACLSNRSYLWRNETTGVYAHRQGAGWIRTPFRRLIAIEDISNGSTRAAVVTVTVDWEGRYGDDGIVLTDVITDWQ